MTRYKFDEIAINIKDSKMPEPSDKETYIGLEHIDSDSIFISRWGNKAELIGKKLCAKKGDLLFGRRNAYLKTAAICPFDCLFSAHGMILRPKENIIAKEYFPFFIKSDNFMDAAIKISVGSLSPTVNWKDLQKLEFELPPIDEQKSLAEILWAAENLNIKYQKAISTINNLVKAKFTSLFGDINAAPKYPEQPLLNVVDIHDDLRKPLSEQVRSKMRSGERLYPYFGATGCVDYINKYNIDMPILCIAEDCGEYGENQRCTYLVSEKCWVNNHAHILRPKIGISNMKYLDNFFTYKDLTSHISGGTRTKLTKNDLKKIRISLPPLNIQEEFSEFSTKIDLLLNRLHNSKILTSILLKNMINQKNKNTIEYNINV